MRNVVADILNRKDPGQKQHHWENAKVKTTADHKTTKACLTFPLMISMTLKKCTDETKMQLF